jgi:hypothetical protein
MGSRSKYPESQPDSHENLLEPIYLDIFRKDPGLLALIKTDTSWRKNQY